MQKILQKSIPPEGQPQDISFAVIGNTDIFELSANMQAIVDSKGSFQRINKAFRDQFGLIQTPPISFLHIVQEADRQRTLTGLLGQSHSITHFENRCCKGDGSVIWISWSLTPLPNGLLLLAGNDISIYKEREALFPAVKGKFEAVADLFGANGAGTAFPLLRTPAGTAGAEKHEQLIAEKTRKLNKAQEELMKIIEFSSGIMFKLAPDGAILFVSPEFERSLGYKNDEVTGKLFSQYIHWEDQVLCGKAVKAVFETRKPLKHMLARAETKHGSWRWLNLSLSVLWDEDMNSLVSIVFAQDFTEMNQMLESLRESDERYAAFVQQSSEAIWRSELTAPVSVTDPEDQQLQALLHNSYLAECNEHFATVYGFESTKDLIGKGLSHFISIADPHAEAFGRSFIRKGYKLNNWPYSIKNSRGEKRYFLASLVGIVENGFIKRIWGMQVDVSVQRKAEKAVRESEERFRQLADSTPVMIWVTDAQGRTSYVNQRWTDFTGLDLAAYLENDWKAILHPDDARDVAPVFEQYARQRLAFNIEYRMKYNDGGYRWVVSHGAPRWLKDGTFVGYTGSISDIQERKWQEELLALEKQVLELNAQPTSTLKVTVNRFLEGIEGLMPDMICSVLTLDEDGITASHLASPSLPGEFAEFVNGSKIGPQAGSCGTAMYLKKPVITTNIHIDPLWAHYRQLARRFGLQACWSLPILNNSNEALATIAAYYRNPRMPSEKELGLLERVANLLRIIIENKKAEARIKMSNERYLLATKATNDAIWDWDVTTGKIFWGDGFYTLFGYKEQRVDSVEFWESCIHPEDGYRVVSSLKTFMQQYNSHIWEAEYRFRKEDGRYTLVHDRGFLIFNHSGTIDRMIGSMQDITEQREMEKKLLKQELDRQKLIAQAVVDAQEKERADIGKELHDNVNQILSTVKLYLEVSKNDEVERLSLINRSTDSISEAINEIRNISRSLVPASISDLGLVESIQDLVENIRATRKLHIEFYHGGDIDALIREKQKLMLFRIVQEQVNNVLKHAEARHLIIELMLEGNMIDLTVSDDGKGFMLEGSNLRKGVGLYNISSRTELFNGKVNIVTAPGEGCKLNIRVPILNQ